MLVATTRLQLTQRAQTTFVNSGGAAYVEAAPSRSLLTGEPPRVEISFIDDPELELKKPIAVEIEIVDGDTLATFREAEICRSGEHANEAFDWLTKSIVELYRLFQRERDNLGPHPKRQLKILEQYIGPKSHPAA